MSQPVKNPFDAMLDAFRQIVVAELEKAAAKNKPAKLLFDTQEAAAMLNVPVTWLAAKARDGEVPYRQVGRYRLFSMQDINQIIAQFRVDSSALYGIYRGHDGEGIQANPPEAGVESIAAGNGDGCMAQHDSALRPRRIEHSGAGGTSNESSPRKKTKGGQD